MDDQAKAPMCTRPFIRRVCVTPLTNCCYSIWNVGISTLQPEIASDSVSDRQVKTKMSLSCRALLHVNKEYITLVAFLFLAGVATTFFWQSNLAIDDNFPSASSKKQSVRKRIRITIFARNLHHYFSDAH